MPKSLKVTTDEDLDLLDELGIDIAPETTNPRSAREERIIAGFEEIQRFVEEQGRLPQHGYDRDIFERLYAVRLDRLRDSEECRLILEPLDPQGLLTPQPEICPSPETDDLSDEKLLATLGIDGNLSNDITQLTHVRARQDIKAAEEIAQRQPCPDFDTFKPLFDQVQHQLKTGERKTLKYQDNAAINTGDLFILDGQKVLVADMGELFISDYGRPNSELRVIYDNGTESNLLLRSLQRALNKDKASRRITKPTTDFGPLFSQVEPVETIETTKTENSEDSEDLEGTNEKTLTSGYIYILRSQSDHPFIVQNRSIIHKIGVTSGTVKKRIANAKKEPTYLFAEVETIATFKLEKINPNKLETLLHKFFDHARLELELPDRFGVSVKPKEWFLVPLEAIEAAIEKIKEGTIDQFQYDRDTATLIPLSRRAPTTNDSALPRA